MRTSSFRKRQLLGFSLAEVFMATAISSVVVAGALGMLVNLQRGFAFSTMWMDVRSREVRVLEAMAVDLRNATYVTPPSATNGVQTLGPNNPLKLTVPKRYADYERSGWTAGDPLRTGGTPPSLIDSLNTRTGKPVFTTSNTMMVQYDAVTAGSSVSITRTVSWSGGPTITRTIAAFPNGVTVKFSDINYAPFIAKPTGPNAASADMSISNTIRTSIEAGAEDASIRRGRTVKATALSDTVFLRMLSTISRTNRTQLY